MINRQKIPEQLKTKGGWCVWKYGNVRRDGKRAKLPYTPSTGDLAKPDDPATFGNFDEAFKAASGGRYDGIGVLVSGTIGAIDIDHCIDEDGGLNSVAAYIMETLPTAYVERSPSSKGIRIFVSVMGEYPDREAFRSKYLINNRQLGLEIYIPGVSSRYVTVTGNTIREGGIPHDPDALEKILQKYMRKSEDDGVYEQMEIRPEIYEVDKHERPQGVCKPVLTDEEIIEIASAATNGEKFKELFDGRWESRYSSASEAELALCQMLAFYTRNDSGQMDSLFRKSGLLREKWDRKEGETTYGKMTIGKAINSNIATYKPPNQEAKSETPRQQEVTQRKSIAISAVDLQAADLPPTKFLVEGILTEGLALLAAPPKSYKSFMGIQLCTCIAQGKDFLGHKTNKNACLYFDLESGHRRPRDRMNMMLSDGKAPDSLYFITSEENPGILGNGFEATLENELAAHPDIALVVIDVLTKIRAQKGASSNMYERDYADLAAVKRIADRHHASVLLIHHTRKAIDPGDIFNTISGSTAIFGATDVTWMIAREKRNNHDATLHITGRDVEATELSISFDTQTMQWKCNGTVEEHQHNILNKEYFESHIIQTIIAVLHRNGGRYEASATQILEDSVKCGFPISEDPRQVGQMINRFQVLLRQHDSVITDYKRRGSERFYIFSFEELDELPFF